MTVRKRSIKSDLAKVDAHRITKAEYDEAPELTKEMLDRAEIRHGDKIIKRGRPPLENPKEAVKLRLDHDVLAAYRKTGRGWQTRINADLRRAARKLAVDQNLAHSFRRKSARNTSISERRSCPTHCCQ
jgi:uncharacterized protein (DUF4415 family)